MATPSNTKFRVPRRVMPGRPLPTPVERDVDERNAQLAQQDAASFSGSLSNCAGGNITGELTLQGALNAGGSDGTNGQVLTSGGAGANPSWQAAGGGGSLATLTDVTLAGVARGDVLYRGAAKWQNLAHGTSGQFLTTNGAGADPSWTTSGGGAGNVAALTGATYAAPDNTLYSWVNQGSAVVTTPGAEVVLRTVFSASENLRIRVKTVPAAPYIVQMAFIPTFFDVNYSNCGMVLRDSGGGGLVTLDVRYNSALAATAAFSATTYNSPTSFNVLYTLTPASPSVLPFQTGLCMWMQIQDDNTHRIFSVSNDGVNWFQVLSVTRTDFITPDQIGYYVESSSPNTSDVCLNVLSMTGG